jgi:hypothetical protein
MTGLSDAHASAMALSTICQSLESEGLHDDIIAMVEARLKGQVPDDKAASVTAAILGHAAVRSAAFAATLHGDGNKPVATALMTLWLAGVMANANKVLKEVLK